MTVMVKSFASDLHLVTNAEENSETVKISFYIQYIKTSSLFQNFFLQLSQGEDHFILHPAHKKATF